MKSYKIDGNKIVDFATFIAEVNESFIADISQDMRWNGHLDAFNDYLRWPDEKYQFVIENEERVKTALSYPETTKRLKNVLERCHPEARDKVRQEILDSQSERGPTLFDEIIDIFANNVEFVNLVLR